MLHLEGLRSDSLQKMALNVALAHISSPLYLLGSRTDAEACINMKIIRTKLNHEYLPNKQHAIFNFILINAPKEFLFMYENLNK